MTRVTRTLPKLTNGVAFRSISTSASTRSPSNLLNTSSESSYTPRKLSELKLECQNRQLKSNGSKAELINRLNAHDITRSHSTTGALHRPSVASQTQHVFRPLMQTFRTSAPKQVTRDNSTIDFFFLPQMPAEDASNSFTIRAPLLPDNYTPHRMAHAPESLDAAIPSPEISIISAHPEKVVAAAMTEVVGNESLEENIEVLSRAAVFTPSKLSSSEEQGTLKGLWNDVLDDVFGPKKASPIIA